MQALNEEYVEKLKQFEKVVSSQHASLEYEVNLRTPEKTDAIHETSAATTDPSSSEKEKTSDEIDFRTLATLMGEQKKQLENECRILRDEIEKLKLIDKNKDEVIHNLKKEIDNCQPLSILDVSPDATYEECQNLKDKCLKLKAKNATMEEELHLLRVQLKQVQNELSVKTTKWEQMEAQIKNDLEEYKEKNEQMMFQVDQLNVTLSEKEEQLKSNSHILIKYVKTFSNYLGERNEIISSALFGNESTNNAIDTLRGKDMTSSIVFDDDSDANDNIVSDFSDYSLQLKDEFLKLKESVDRMINVTVASFEKLVTLTEVINRKDELLEEMNQEKDTLRREFQDAMESDRKEIDLLKHRYDDLNKASLFFFFFPFIFIDTLSLQLPSTLFNGVFMHV